MRALMVALAVAEILAVACGGAGAPAAGASAGRVITIEMSDLAFSPATITLKPGERVTLSFKNVRGSSRPLAEGPVRPLPARAPDASSGSR